MDIETLADKKVDVRDVSTVSLRDMYMRMCACRDFEISHVWQRAIFLTAFLLGCFTAYGFWVNKFWSCVGFKFSVLINAVCFAVSLVGVAISILWICLAKGAKAWQEVYENAIKGYSVIHADGVDKDAVILSQFRWRKLINDARKKDSDIKDDRNRFVLSLQGGAYSVSKIVIAIGILSTMIWIAISLSHIALFVKYCSGRMSLYKHIVSIARWLFANDIGMTIMLACVALVFTLMCVWWLKSGYLTEKDEKKF